MALFLDVVGLRRQVHTTGDGFVTFAGSSGDVAVRPSDDFERDRKLFAAFGFEPVSDGSENWQALRAQPGTGTIGLHPPIGVTPAPRERTADNPVGTPIRIDLGFETDEPMNVIAARLVAAGYADARVDEQPFGSSVIVTDPDGCSVQIHPRSR